MGGGKLGWIAHNNPAGAEGFYGSTEVKGTIPIWGRETGWKWVQQKRGTRTYTEGGVVVQDVVVASAPS